MLYNLSILFFPNLLIILLFREILVSADAYLSPGLAFKYFILYIINFAILN